TQITYCQNETASQLTATGTNLLWYTSPTGGTGSTTAPTPLTTNIGTTSYYVSQITGVCESNRTQINVVVNAIPETPVITQDQNILTSSDSTGNQWYDSNGLIIGETNQTFTVTADGDYYVIVTENGCSSSQSNTINVIIIGISEMSMLSTINIYPNPVKNELTVEITNSTAKCNFELTNILGETIYSSTIDKKDVINTSNFSSGVYLVKLNIDKSTIIKRFVKQ
ncbi:MAG: T9SS type A sorting domain-containing protein, partial [Bacteroidia bacterium]|nr:T9SS type A sorting domain-containing protein [Bacteroidia bacterium]